MGVILTEGCCDELVDIDYNEQVCIDNKTGYWYHTSCALDRRLITEKQYADGVQEFGND